MITKTYWWEHTGHTHAVWLSSLHLFSLVQFCHLVSETWRHDCWESAQSGTRPGPPDLNASRPWWTADFCLSKMTNRGSFAPSGLEIQIQSCVWWTSHQQPAGNVRRSEICAGAEFFRNIGKRVVGGGGPALPVLGRGDTIPPACVAFKYCHSLLDSTSSIYQWRRPG